MENVSLDIERMKMYVFKDDKSNSYGQPITYVNTGMFIRDVVQEELKRGTAIFARHPQDFSIYEIGEYDVYLGKIHLYETKKCLGLVQDFRVGAN